MDGFNLYWKGLWMRPCDVGKDTLLISNEKLERNLNGAYKRGKDDAQLPAFREGIEDMGFRIRGEIARILKTTNPTPE